MKRRLFGCAAFLFFSMGAAGTWAVAQQMGHVKIEAVPRRAGIFVDGEYIGPATNHGSVRRYDLPPGAHQVTLRDSAHSDLSFEVNVAAGETTTLSREMEPRVLAEPPFGTLRTIHEDKFGAVYINGAYMGFVDEFNNRLQGLLLNPGEYEIRIEPVNGAAVERTIAIQAGRTTLVR